MRRIDVAKSLCAQMKRKCTFTYSDPWLYGEDTEPVACAKRFRRDIGAVVMFFFQCPKRVNCAADWANNHVRGMSTPDSSLGGGYYNASNPAFWTHELRDAKRAGLQYIAPNLYGPDMQAGEVDTLAHALAGEADPVKIALFDDSWAWGEVKFGMPWAKAPDLNHTESAAKTLYEAKWKPYFSKISKAYWYRIDNRPVIYVYNAGTLKPASKAAAVLKRMKTVFAADFGVEPYLAIDDAFFADPDMVRVADTRFRWDTFDDFAAKDGTVSVNDQLSRSSMNGRVMANAMVRWDSSGRDHDAPHWNRRRVKGPERLQSVLDRTTDADNLLIATWNDLGEGTGINAAYDYDYKGEWLAPDAFMSRVRQSNCIN